MQEHERIEKIFRRLDKIAFWVSLSLLVTLTILYFFLPKMGFIPDDGKLFLAAIITNLIPTILVLCLSYMLIRELQIIRAESSQRAIANDLAQAITPILNEKIAGLSNSMNEKMSDISNSLEQVKQNVHSVQDALMTLWQIQENSQKIIDGLIDKLPIATPQTMTDFLGSVNKISKSPKLPKTKIRLTSSGGSNDENQN